MRITPYQVEIADDILRDLQQRLAQTRWPGEIADTGWDYGSNLAYVKELVHYWQTDFNWRQQEQMLNAFAHFRADIDGLGIHFIHEARQRPEPDTPHHYPRLAQHHF